MATIYVDPSRSTNGAGSFADPRNIFPTSLAYGDFVLFKEGTVYKGTWTLPTPSGTGSAINVVTLGTYNSVTGLQTEDTTKQATIQVVNTATDALFISSVSYVTIKCLRCVGGNEFPYAGIRALNSSYITVDKCTAENVDGLNGAYGIRFDNATGSGSTQSNWVIKNSVIKNIAGNAGILCVWSSTSGEFVSNITIKNNVVESLRYSEGANAYGISVQSRATTFYADKAGLCAKGVQIKDNVIRNIPAYSLYVKGANSGAGYQANIVSGNTILNGGNGLADAHCLWLGACYNFVVSNNKINKSNALIGGQTGTGVGIFIDYPAGDSLDGCEDVLVTRNIVSFTGQGNTPNIEVGGAGIFVLHSRRITVSYNVVQYCLNGIVIWGGNNAGDRSQNVNVYNNTVANNSGPGIYICKIADLVSVRNNLSYKNAEGFYIENSGAGAITNYTEENNLVWQCGVKWTGGNLPTTATGTATARTPGGSNLDTDPKITSVYNIGNTGAAYKAGLLVNPKLSQTGFSFYPAPSIGAYEYVAPRGVR